MLLAFMGVFKISNVWSFFFFFPLSFRLCVLFNFFRFIRVRLGLYCVIACGSSLVRVLFSLLVTAWNRAG